MADNSRLAIAGGTPVRTEPPAPWPSYSPEEIAAASNVLESGRVNYWSGENCATFEREFADYHGARHAVTLANGTLALELALRVLGVGPGDEVIVTPRSYFASASCIVCAGAKPVFADVDRDSQNSTVDSIRSSVSERTKAIIAVHLAGWPCDMPGILSLAGEHGLHVVEDCAQAHGATIDGRPVGSFGDLAAFSFCQDKIMSTAGEGGMLLTSDETLWEAAWSYKDHGKCRSRVVSNDHPVGFRWLHDGFGSNWRLTELQAAVGRIQLAKLDDWVEARRRNAARLAEGFADIDALRVPLPAGALRHAYYRFYSFVVPERLKSAWNRDRVLDALAAEGIPGLSGSCPEIYRERAFDGWSYDRLPVARELGETSLAFLVHPTMSEADLEDTVAAVTKVFAAATG